MDNFRNEPPAEINGLKTKCFKDYLKSIETDFETGAVTKLTLPSSNVLAFILENDSKVMIRPSGTEPKIKVYIEAIADSREASIELSDELKNKTAKLMGF